VILRTFGRIDPPARAAEIRYVRLTSSIPSAGDLKTRRRCAQQKSRRIFDQQVVEIEWAV
jgi:hypothetical protein